MNIFKHINSTTKKDVENIPYCLFLQLAMRPCMDFITSLTILCPLPSSGTSSGHDVLWDEEIKFSLWRYQTLMALSELSC